MSYREVSILRALRMLGSAKRSLENGDYDIAAFVCEQAAQLYLKSVIFELIGEVPCTHSIRQLLSALASILGKLDDVNRFVSCNRSC